MDLKRDWLESEQARNRANAGLYTEMVKTAYGCDEAVLIGHHICFEKNGDIETENEIPAADALIFDHAIMTKIFGKDAVPIMIQAAAKPVPERDDYIRKEYGCRYAKGVCSV